MYPFEGDKNQGWQIRLNKPDSIELVSRRK